MCFAFCLCASGVIVAVFLAAVFASLVDVWPYKLAPTLKNSVLPTNLWVKSDVGCLSRRKITSPIE
jgi:hypothetical protein